mmetsp:Transcript_52380/g.63131  ORF Transcript_52380/g.63131 Transcript_52380/m.63131 type:complete len:90 (-) Transcript_52380:1421-1690(-)
MRFENETFKKCLFLKSKNPTKSESCFPKQKWRVAHLSTMSVLVFLFVCLFVDNLTKLFRTQRNGVFHGILSLLGFCFERFAGARTDEAV